MNQRISIVKSQPSFFLAGVFWLQRDKEQRGLARIREEARKQECSDLSSLQNYFVRYGLISLMASPSKVQRDVLHVIKSRKCLIIVWR